MRISKSMVEFLKARYPKGCRVELVEMDDPYTKLTAGDRGTVIGVDDMGTIHVRWDNGSKLGVAYGVDTCKKIN